MTCSKRPCSSSAMSWRSRVRRSASSRRSPSSRLPASEIIRSCRAYSSANSISRRARSRCAGRFASRSRCVAQSRRRLGRHALELQEVDPAQEAGQEPGRVPADLVAAKRQVVDAVEQDRQAVGCRDGGEERIEARLGRVLAQDPLGDLGVGADPRLLVGVGEDGLDPVAKRRRSGARAAGDKDPLGAHAVLRERCEAANQRLRAPGPCGARHEEGSAAVADHPPLRLVHSFGSTLHAARTLPRPASRRSTKFTACSISTGSVRCGEPSRPIAPSSTPSRPSRAAPSTRGSAREATTRSSSTAAAEDAVFAELEKLHAESGADFVAISEERGEVAFGDPASELARRGRPDRRLDERAPHDPLALPERRDRLRAFDGRRPARLRLRVRRRRGVHRQARRGRLARRPKARARGRRATG